MAQTAKARKAIIQLGSNLLEVFQLPTGEYRLSQSEVTGVIGKPNRSIIEFLQAKSSEVLQYKEFELSKALPVESSNKPIKPISIQVATAYWRYWDKRNNLQASALVDACVLESIERRADKAFGIERTEREYNDRFNKIVQTLAEALPDLQTLDAYAQNSTVFEDYDAIAPTLNKHHKHGIPGKTETQFRNDIASLSWRTERWGLQVEKEISFDLEDKQQYSYPDLTSRIFLCNVKGKTKQVILIFECKDPIVDADDIRECLYTRRYISQAQRQWQVDHVFLFFVAPYGGNRYAESFLRNFLPPEYVGFVRIITVEQMTEFLLNKVNQSVQNPERKDEIRKEYEPLLEYPIPQTPPATQEDD